MFDNIYDRYFSKVIIKDKIIEKKTLNSKIEKYLLKNFSATIFKKN